MPIYSFKCKDCDKPTELFLAHTRYVEQSELGFPSVHCGDCGSREMERDIVADMRTQYTERAQYFSDLTPDEVAGKGGYSRERKKLLKEAKLVEKGDLPKCRRRVSYTLTEADIRARMESRK